MIFFNIISKNSNLVLKCSKFIRSKGNDVIHFLVKNSSFLESFNFLKEYLNKHPNKVNIQNKKDGHH